MKNNHSPNSLLSSFTRLLLVAALILPISGLMSEGVKTLKPGEVHPLSGKMIAKLLGQYHYNHNKIDDATSAEVLDLYIESYDRNRMYFLASDILSFEKYRYELDDHIMVGNLEAAYLIFNTLQFRVEQRLNYVEQRLKTEFNYNLDETYQLDRSEKPWAKSTAELDDLWRKKLKNEALNLKLAGKDWEGIQETLMKRYSNLQRRIEQYKSEDVFAVFVNALSETYDPHTSYFSPISSENFGIDMSLSLEGIGAELTTEDDHTKVVRIIPGGPADRSKQLWANDKIIGVAQGLEGKFEDVIGLRLDDVVQKIRGRKGSVVRLEIIQADAPVGSPSKEIALIRDKVILEERAAKSDTVEFMHEGRNYKLGIITIPSFYVDLNAQRKGDPNYKSTTRDVRRLIRELEGAGVDGLIVDLRRNGGGSLQEAIELTGLFIEDGPVVQVKSFIGSKKVESDPDPNIVYTGPLGVMVDRFSASASEIFSAAIQDYGRGIVLGHQTYGKGTVQNLISLDRFIKSREQKYGQLKITVAKFYRVTGSSTQHRGVLPDISFPSIYDEMDYGEDKQLHALPWDEITQAMFRPHDKVSMFLSSLRLNSKKRVASDREFQFIHEEIAEYARQKNRNAISLRESDRMAERDRLEKIKYDRVNQRRANKGLARLQKGDKIPDDDRTPDAVLDESKLVMADLIALSNTDGAQIAKTANGQKSTKNARTDGVSKKNKVQQKEQN